MQTAVGTAVGKAADKFTLGAIVGGNAVLPIIAGAGADATAAARRRCAQLWQYFDYIYTIKVHIINVYIHI